MKSILVMYIEKEIVQEFDTDSVIDYFKNMKTRRAKLQMFVNNELLNYYE